MQLIERDRCAVSGHRDLEHLFDFPNFPVFMGCVTQPEHMDLKQDMCWWISRSSGLIQLKRLLPLDVLYPESHGAGSVGGLWLNHHRAFARFINRSRPSAVFEIGGAHGILAREYHRYGEVAWTIIEPNPSPVDGCNARFIRGYFEDNTKLLEESDAIIHSHVFEHMYDPEDFMGRLSSFMKAGQNLIFSLPNMHEMMRRKYTNCINFEHTVFLTEPYTEYLLAQHGFKILCKEYFMDDHSIFYLCMRDPKVKPIELSPALYETNKRLYLDYIDYHKTLVADLNQWTSQATRPIFLFGAHVFSQYLIEMGLNTENIVCLLDNDTKKQGRRLYGTKMKVESPKILSNFNQPVVILKAGIYNDEIKTDIIENINTAASFV